MRAALLAVVAAALLTGAPAAAAPPVLDDNAGLDQYLESAPEADGGPGRSRDPKQAGLPGTGAGARAGNSDSSPADPDEQVLSAIASSGPNGPPASGAARRGSDPTPAAQGASRQSAVASDRSAADVVGGRILGDPVVALGLAALLLVVGVGVVRLYRGRAVR